MKIRCFSLPSLSLVTLSLPLAVVCQRSRLFGSRDWPLVVCAGTTFNTSAILPLHLRLIEDELLYFCYFQIPRYTRILSYSPSLLVTSLFKLHYTTFMTQTTCWRTAEKWISFYRNRRLEQIHRPITQTARVLKS